MNTEHISQTRQTRLEVQLTTLREVGFLSVVVELEQACTTLDRSLDDARRGDFHDSVLGVGGSEGGQDSGSDLHDGGRCFGSEIEMSQVLTDRQVGFLGRM